MPQTSPKVLIGIITRNRIPQLERCLTALLPETAGRADVLVIDNSDIPNRTTYEAPNLRIAYCDPGYCEARNIALREARPYDALIYVDDDQVVPAGWFQAIVQCWMQHPDAVINGPTTILPVGDLTDEAVSDALTALNRNVHSQPSQLTLFGAGNTLIPVATWLGVGAPEFRSEFADLGGEDTDFSRRIIRAGVPAIRCREAEVVEYYEAERLTRRWFAQRAMVSGEIRGIELRLSQPVAGRLRSLMEGLLRLLTGIGQGAMVAIRQRRLFWPQDFYRFLRGLGLVRAAFRRHRQA